MKAHVVSVNVSLKKGTRKKPCDAIRLVIDHGIEGDAHAGPWIRQVSLLAEESIARMKAKDLVLHPGDFAENITTSGLELWSIPVGTRICIGDEVILEVTQIGKECHQGCDIRRQVGDCVMPREGIFAKVIQGGFVRRGECIAIKPGESTP